MASICVRSTPVSWWSGVRMSKRGSLSRGFFLVRGPGSGAAGAGASVATGQPGRAHECAQEAMNLARERAELAYEAGAVALLGDIASSRAPCDMAAAEQHYSSALRVLEDIGMRPFLACCHLRLGTLYGRNGKGQAAREHLATA